MELTAPEIVFGIALIVAGVATGILVGRRGETARRKALEEELDRERTERARYQDQVVQHFGKTSDLFRDLTAQYGALYSHLAEGARDLCADRVPALGQGFNDLALLPSRETTATPAAPPTAVPAEAAAELATPDVVTDVETTDAPVPNGAERRS